jgi:hypothetical protein
VPRVPYQRILLRLGVCGDKGRPFWRRKRGRKSEAIFLTIGSTRWFYQYIGQSEIFEEGLYAGGPNAVFSFSFVVQL